jgi:hypothetical protein
MPQPTPETANSFIKDNIVKMGLEITDWIIFKRDPEPFYDKPGQNKKEFEITIPYNVDSIESDYVYTLIFCVQSAAQIQKVRAKATLERKIPPTISMTDPIQLKDKDGSTVIPFPNEPDGPKNYYHRWWIWPNYPQWREPDDYILKIWLGYNKFDLPFSEKDWMPEPFIFNIKVKKLDPPKTKKIKT